MKCLVGFLTLICLAGCQASLVRDPPVQSPLEQIPDDIQDIYKKAVKSFAEYLEAFTEPVKKLRDLTSETVQKYQLSPEFQRCMQRFAKDMNQKWQGTFNQIRGRTNQMLEVVGGEQLQKTLSELPAKAKHFSEDVKVHIQPLAQQLQESFSRGAEQARQSVQPLVEGLKQKTVSLAEDVQTSASNLYRSLVE